MVTLKNGQEEAKIAVGTVMMLLNNLIKSDPICFYELVMKCRDRNYIFFWKTWDKLKGLWLVEGEGSINNSIKNVVLSAVTWESINMVLSSPIKKTTEEINDVLKNEWNKESKEKYIPNPEMLAYVRNWRNLLSDKPELLVELVKKAKDTEYKLAWYMIEFLNKKTWLVYEDGSLNRSTADIILYVAKEKNAL